MAQQHRALDWLARRHAGESAALIAWRAGVDKKTVLRATKDFGPFPRPTQQLNGRHAVSEAEISERTARWIEERRRGRSVQEIADAHGFSHQLVSRATVDHGPFPSEETVAAWVEARRQRRTLAEIGLEYGIPADRVAHHTAPLGPFPSPARARLPDGVLGISAVAARIGLTLPSVLRWRKSDRLPCPDFTTARGRDLWLATSIDAWIEQSEWLVQCTDCGARCVSVSRHRALAHEGVVTG